jgi:hypothetical protein
MIGIGLEILRLLRWANPNLSDLNKGTSPQLLFIGGIDPAFVRQSFRKALT